MIVLSVPQEYYGCPEQIHIDFDELFQMYNSDALDKSLMSCYCLMKILDCKSKSILNIGFIDPDKITNYPKETEKNLLRKTNDVQEGTTNGVQEGSGVICDDPEYNPKEDEVVVHKTVKALKTTSKKRKTSEASATMPPGRVMAPSPGQTKRILEPDEPDRVTRHKATMAAATDHQESLLGMDFESLVEMRDEFS
ncbi:hypothetical protein ZWY2020_026933 [Hordeum vulgare]|nr:hypothetical protein ZWY2020_026933 [Hordeum vulgare]